MQLYFIRHGQSSNNALWDATGAAKGRSADPELTAIGKQQARLLADYLAQGGNRFSITHLYTSLMIRSIETALAVAKTLGLPVAAWEDVHETGGIFEEQEDGTPIGLPGNTRTHFEAAYPALALPNSLNALGWWNRPFEDRTLHAPRASQFVADLLARHGSSSDVVAVVSHGNFYRHVMAVILRMPDPDSYYFSMNNTALTRIDFPAREGDFTVVHYQNRVEHLPPALLT